MINTYIAEREAIEEQFKDIWQNKTPILFENTRQKLPKTGSVVRFKIIGEQKTQNSIGKTQLHRNIGQVFIEVSVKRGTGLDIVYDLADLAQNAFNIIQLDSIQFRSAYQIIVGEDGDDWFRINVICPFYRNSIVIT